MKKIISYMICISLIMSICIPIAFANEINDFKATVSTAPPEGVVLQEGETWVPAQTSAAPAGIPAPDGFTYMGYSDGNCQMDAIADNIASGAITLTISAISSGALAIPGFVTYIYDVSTDVMSYYSTPKTQQGDYRDYIFDCDDTYAFCGFAYPYIYYHYIEYYAYIYQPSSNTYKKIVADVRDSYEYSLLPR